MLYDQEMPNESELEMFPSSTSNPTQASKYMQSDLK